MTIARRTFLTKLASASGGVMLTPSLAGLAAFNGFRGRSHSASKVAGLADRARMLSSGATAARSSNPTVLW